MKLFEKNLATLRRNNSLLAESILRVKPSGDLLSLERARNGQPSAKKNGVLLHSTYDPGKEALAWLSSAVQGEPRKLCVPGCGLGYHLAALADKGYHGAFIEPDPALFRLALEQQDLTALLENFRPLVGVSLETLRRAQRDLLAGETIAHPASVRANPSYFSPLIDYGRALSLVRRGGLKILLVNPLYGGSLPAARLSAAALERQGHTVEVFTSESFALGHEYADQFTHQAHKKEFTSGLVSLLGKGILLKAQEFEPDLVLALAQAPLHLPTLGRLEQMGIPTAFWFVEDYLSLPYWRIVAPNYGYFFGIQKGEFVSQLRSAGVRNYAYLPTAAAPEIHTPLTLTGEEQQEFGSPLSFIGSGYHNRQRFFRGLLDYSFKIWGSEWQLTRPLAPCIQRDAARVDTETCVKIFNSSAINLNLHSSTYHEGIDPAGDFVNPRTFEIACCSAFQLVDRRSLISELFADDELETFGSMEELRTKIDHYLADPAGRQRVAAKGRARVLEEHTYEARMEELLTLMLCAFPRIAERQESRLNKEHTVRNALESLPGMDEVMQHLPASGGIDLASICDAIDNVQGTLTRAERIFLMLKNMQPAKGSTP